jgi:hypothetical protein
LFCVNFVFLAWHNDIEKMLAYGWSDWPTHEAFGGRNWMKKTFSKISLFEEHCSDPSLQSPLSENTDGTVVQTQPTKYNYIFKLQLFTKDTTQSPLEVVKGWYAKLTLDEQKVCEIQNADEPVDHFSDGRVHWTENPHPSPHKTRYKIDIRPEISQKIMQNSEPADLGTWSAQHLRAILHILNLMIAVPISICWSVRTGKRVR